MAGLDSRECLQTGAREFYPKTAYLHAAKRHVRRANRMVIEPCRYAVNGFYALRNGKQGDAKLVINTIFAHTGVLMRRKFGRYQ